MFKFLFCILKIKQIFLLLDFFLIIKERLKKKLDFCNSNLKILIVFLMKLWKDLFKVVLMIIIKFIFLFL